MHFKKRETLTQNITFMAIMAAINVVCVLLSTFVPVLMFIMVFFLPLTSTLVTLYCKKRYYIIYAVVTIGLCMLVTMYNISDTLFYVIPSIITGFIFGVMVLKKVHAIWIIFTTSIIQLLLTYVMIPVTYFWLGINIIDTFTAIFGLTDYIYLDYIVPMFIYFMSLGQSAITYVITKNELPKFNYQVTDNTKVIFAPYIGELCSVILTIVFALTYKELSYLCMMFSMYFGVFIAISSIYRDGMKAWISVPISFVFALFVFAAIYQFIEEPLGLLGLEVMFIITCLDSVVCDLLVLKKKPVHELDKEIENKYFD